MKKLAILAVFLALPCFAQVNIKGPGVQIGSSSTGATGVTSIKADGNPALTGDVTISCGAGLSCTQSGNTISISTAPPFSIIAFGGGQTVELGVPVVNPTFTANYTTTPASAQISNSEGIGSPLILSSPFTAGTVSGTFVHSSAFTTTFTLSATQGITQTLDQQINWQPRIFGGVGSAGATPSVTASGTTAVLSTGDALGTIQLGAESAGQVLGTFNPAGQYVYLLLMNPGHAFVDANTGFPFAIDAPITVHFVNVNGVTVTMYLYRSTNALNIAVQPKVVS